MKNKILIVDDAEINREVLADILENEYDILQASNGREALEILKNSRKEISAVLLDLMMPEVDGFAVLEVMKTEGWMENLPVLIISGETSVKAEKRCFEYGVSDFVRKPFDNMLVNRRVNNVVGLYELQKDLQAKVDKQTEKLRIQYKLLQVQAEKLHRTNENIIDILGTVVENRSLESGAHIKHVKGFTRVIAERVLQDYPEYGLTKAKVDIIVSASALHDIGKIAIPDSILLKPGKLNEKEYDYMKSHTTRGCDILDSIEDIWDEEYKKVGYEICRHHHERFDGRGYPDKLAGDDIPISAQIVSVADVYDALISERVYKGAYSKDEAYHMILRGECGVFSPKLMECFRSVKKELEMVAAAQGE